MLLEKPENVLMKVFGNVLHNLLKLCLDIYMEKVFVDFRKYGVQIF